ncbi:MAG: prolyl oligopeptidase family serine peptidase, partial [Mariniblastus sp.]|nr:prolyl oligopeptidase family serine peptidase [Mariniblastus sp.]
DKQKDDKQKDDKQKDDKQKDDKQKDDKQKDDEEEEEKELPIPKIGPELDDTAIRLSEDGEEKFGFVYRSRRSSGTTDSKQDQDESKAAERKSRPRVTWSEDSQSFYITRSDSRDVKELWVINSLAEPRPTLQSYSYPMPGEEGVRVSHLHYFSRADKKLKRVEPKWKHENYRNLHWEEKNHQLRFVRMDRLVRNCEVCELNPETGELNCLIEDGFEAANVSPQSVRYLEKTDELIWWSERSGWGHFYLYDHDGTFKNPITAGEFRASRIVDVDEENRLVYFQANGREPGENLYQQHLYSVHLNGTGLKLLDPGDANHRSTLSPTKKYLVDNCSRVDMAPVSILRDAQGNEVMKLEESDLSRIEQVGWKMPTTFVVKAADGITDLYGNMWKPFDFKPNRKYPIIAHVYPGPQMEGTSHTFSSTSGNQQLAQLGFIVIQVGHRGGTPQRSKAYHSHGYYNLRDYGLADKKAAIEQLGQRFPFIDVERVGIYGHSGGGFMTAAALLQEPYNDFFKVGVATAGNHDNNIYGNYWAERYHGLKLVQGDAEQSTDKAKSAVRRSQSTRSGAPTVADLEAISVEESDFFYEHEGAFNLDGEFQEANDPWQDGPQAFLSGRLELQDKENKQEQKQEEKTEKTVDSNRSKESDERGKRKSGGREKEAEKSEQEVKFDIEVPTNAELAANLKGHLFLVHGEADNNVHPANTLRLVDALITANKRFDMLYLPGTRHGFGRYQPYVTQRMYEFFAEHLLDDYQSGVELSERE